MSKKIIFSTGGTGGHIFPAINLMKHFVDKEYEVLLVTDSRGDNFMKENIKFKSYILNTGTPTNKNLIKKILSIFLIFYSILKAVFILKKEKPNLVFGFGGYVSFPISFASKFFNFPLVIYENNMILGRANKYLSSFSKKIFVAKKIVKKFPQKYESKSYVVGPIIDKNIINFLNFKKNSNNSFSLLVLGGSLGAEVFGKIIPSVIKMVKDKGHDIEIIQQCTANQKNFITDFYKKNNIKNYVFEFDKNILKLILSSNLAITRCGASTTAELTHTLTPFIGIPLPNSVDNHQYLNAKYYENKDCCWILEEENLSIENLSKLIITIIENKKILKNISENMEKIKNTNVYTNIENEIKNLI